MVLHIYTSVLISKTSILKLGKYNMSMSVTGLLASSLVGHLQSETWFKCYLNIFLTYRRTIILSLSVSKSSKSCLSFSLAFNSTRNFGWHCGSLLGEYSWPGNSDFLIYLRCLINDLFLIQKSNYIHIKYK